MKPTAEAQRLFFALWPEENVRAELGRRLRTLPSVAGRPVSLANLHLTLVFIGSADDATRTCLEQAAGEVRCPPFELVLDCTGHFARPQVFWLGASHTPAPLLELVQALRAAQRNCGGEPEERPFRAHLTVARKVRQRPEIGPLPGLHWPVDRFALVRSRTLPEGASYQPQNTWMLRP